MHGGRILGQENHCHVPCLATELFWCNISDNLAGQVLQSVYAFWSTHHSLLGKERTTLGDSA